MLTAKIPHQSGNNMIHNNPTGYIVNMFPDFFIFPRMILFASRPDFSIECSGYHESGRHTLTEECG